MTAIGWGLWGGGRIEQKRKKVKKSPWTWSTELGRGGWKWKRI